MRILFVSDTYYPQINGVYYFVCRIGPLLKERGHAVAVIAPSESVYSSLKKVDGLDVFGIPSLPVFYYPSIRVAIPYDLKFRVNKIIQDFKPDVIHVQDHFPISKAVIKVIKDLNIPVIGTNHFMPENITVLLRGEGLKRVVDKWLWKGFSKVYNQINLVTTPTETGARLIRPWLKKQVLAISSGISLETFNAVGDTDNIKIKYNIPDKPVLLYVGRLDPEKHIEEILEAVAAAVKKINFCLVVVGKGIRKEALEELTHKMGITSNVIFTGYVPDEDLPYFYKLSRCFIISSIAELLSLGMLQAMASGLPIIAVNAGALGELVNDSVNGYLYKEGDIPAMVQYIENIITNDELFSKMSQKSLEISRKHDIYKTVDSFENLYRKLYDKQQVTFI